MAESGAESSPNFGRFAGGMSSGSNSEREGSCECDIGSRSSIIVRVKWGGRRGFKKSGEAAWGRAEAVLEKKKRWTPRATGQHGRHKKKCLAGALGAFEILRDPSPVPSALSRSTRGSHSLQWRWTSRIQWASHLCTSWQALWRAPLNTAECIRLTPLKCVFLTSFKRTSDFDLDKRYSRGLTYHI